MSQHSKPNAEKTRLFYRRYGLRWLRSVGIILVVVVSFNGVVDPFDAFRVVYVSGFNTVKPKLKRFTRLSKSVQIQRRQPRALVMGSSRSEFGYPMTHPGWQGYSSVYNMAMSGSSIHHVLRFFQHAVEQAPIQHVLIGVDFFMFNTHNLTPLAEDSILSVRENGQANWDYRVQQGLKLLLSVDALGASISTLSKQDAKYARYTEGGRMTPSQRKKRAETPYRETFLATELSYALNAWTPCANSAFQFQRQDGSKNTLEMLRQILRLAKQRQIQVTLVISPSHARLWELMRFSGLWGQFEAWKRHLVGVVETSGDTALWDFSGYHQYAIESVPKRGLMQWYMDTSHYTVALGWRVLDQIFGYPGEGKPFGVRLSAQNVDAHLRKIRVSGAQYRQLLDDDDVEAMRQMSEKYRARRISLGKVCG